MRFLHSQGARIIMTFIGFVAVVAVLATAGLWWQKLQQAPRQSEVSAPESQDRLFYQTLGQFNKKRSDNEKLVGSADRYTLEIKIASSKQEAERLIDMLTDMGVRAYYTPLSREGRVLYRVRRGVYPSSRRATVAQRELRSRYKLQAKVTRLE